MAIKTKTGVIIGADTRTSSGRFIPSRFTDKLTKLTDTIYCCRSGSAADTRIIADIVSLKLKDYEYTHSTKPTVKLAAKLCQKIIYENKSFLAGIIIAGYDDEEKESVYNITLGGSMVKMDIALGGSGSIFIYGFCDTNYRNDMNEEEAVKFVQASVTLAIKRDNSSGGCIRMAIINENGVERLFIPGNELNI